MARRCGAPRLIDNTFLFDYISSLSKWIHINNCFYYFLLFDCGNDDYDYDDDGDTDTADSFSSNMKTEFRV